MILWEPNSTPRIRSDARAFCWRFFGSIPFFAILMLIFWAMSGHWIPWRDVLVILSSLAAVSLFRVWSDGRDLPVSYHFRDGMLVVHYRDGSQDDFARWVRIRKPTTGIIHAQNDRRTLEITEVMYATPMLASEAMPGK